MPVIFRDNFVRQVDAWIVPVDETHCRVRVRGLVPSAGDRMDLMWPKGTAMSSSWAARTCLCTVIKTDGAWSLVERPSGVGDAFQTQSAIASKGVLQSRAGETFCTCQFAAGPNSIAIKRALRPTP